MLTMLYKAFNSSLFKRDFSLLTLFFFFLCVYDTLTAENQVENYHIEYG